jgi:hypothetical protein
MIWVSTDPVTKRDASTGAKDIESALEWRDERRKKAVTRKELRTLWRAFENFDSAAQPTAVVYFVRSRITGHLKIGSSSRFGDRLRALTTANPGGLDVLLLLAGDPTLERLCHSAFRPLRFHGEWFEYRDELARFVEAMSEQPIVGRMTA